MNRRQFVAAAALVSLGGCAGHMAPHPPAGPVALGKKPSEFAEGIDSRWADKDGFFIVRQAGSLFAVSVACTHRECEVEAEGRGGLTCPCHGSQFDVNGHVLKGPAKIGLSHFGISVDGEGNVVVDPQRQFKEAEWGTAGSVIRLG